MEDSLAKSIKEIADIKNTKSKSNTTAPVKVVSELEAEVKEIDELLKDKE